jgi:hypothetical protein
MNRAVPLFVLLLASGIAGCAHTHSAAGSLAATTSTSRTVLHQTERTVWSEQLVSSRQYVAAAFANDRSAHADLTQLERSQEAIGQTIKPYYGVTAGDGLTAMLKQQVAISLELVHAVKSGNLEDKDEIEGRLHENSNAIARFLAGLNPYWSPSELETIFNSYVDLSARDIVARKDGHMDGNDTDLDRSLSQARRLGDVIADGIVQQFPHGPPNYPLDSD